jgi:hypothetical protein
MRCPHGMPGGLTRRLCAECAAEARQKGAAEASRRAAELRREWEHAERLRQVELRRRREEEERRRRRQDEQRKAELCRAAERLQCRELARARTLRLRQLDSLLRLSPRDFERNVAKLYERFGFRVQLTPAVGDQGRTGWRLVAASSPAGRLLASPTSARGGVRGFGPESPCSPGTQLAKCTLRSEEGRNDVHGHEP